MVRSPLRVGVVGAEHLHLFQMVDRLVAAGFETVCHAADEGPLRDLYEGYRTDSERRTEEDVLADDSLDLIVIAAVPSDRGRIAVAALRSRHDVLVAKPAVTTAADLAEVDRAIATTNRRWSVFFSERLENRAVSEAVRLCRGGAIGRVVAVTGHAPHLLAPEGRPDWFFDPARSGGILVDLASHQVDQVLALGGTSSGEVLSATVAHVATPDHPTMQDLGRMSLRVTTDDGVIVSDHHVDWLSSPGLGTWGDVRLVIVGTEGSIEVRSNIDPAGQPGAEHLILVDAEGPRRIDVSAVRIDWAERLRDAMVDAEEDSPFVQWNDLEVSHITLRAQQMAEAAR